RLHITLQGDREQTTADVQAELRQSLAEPTDDLADDLADELAGVVTSVEDVQFVDTGGEKPLQVSLLGEDLDALNRAAADVKKEVEKLPGLVDIRVSGEANTADEIVEINHRRGERAVYISANLLPGKALGEATGEVTKIAQSVIPLGVRTDLGSDSARAGEVLGSFGKTLGLAVICMLVVVFIPFGRLLEPLVVGLSLPLSIVGAMLALLVTRSDFGVISLLGLLFLLGLLDKNALLLLDYANQLRRAGMQRADALVKTGLVRLRPILMTTASTVLGMTPLALKLGAGAELRQPMAVAIIGGLLTSTLLSLIVVPVLYALLEDGWLRMTQLWGKRRHRSGHVSK
ncbi:MAG: efflux RND transporter permease subunit, partial [Phormidesmis sp.]